MSFSGRPVLCFEGKWRRIGSVGEARQGRETGKNGGRVG